MADIVDSKTRSRMMSGIRGKNTKAEIEIRKKLFAAGFRYRLHDTRLPGKPDIILPKYKAVIFVHGCFWHAHDCELFKIPSTRTAFWRKKLKGNRNKDEENDKNLKKEGWRILTIWECAFRGAGKNREKQIDRIVEKAVKWLNSKSRYREIRG
ncbi:MAG TPA: DNA mismatch endonuclease Vsr [candidate division Zixibacteria bacterium]|nr:DNA mismatch endonuclease Vsr [candidate division Zixibacteria bacterium]